MIAWRPNFDWITHDLAVGGSFPPGLADGLARRHGVGAVIDVRVEACDDVEELAACGLAFLQLPTRDRCGVSQPLLDRGVDFAGQMTAQGRRVLIHCQHGVGRSAIVALCALGRRGLGPLDALRLVKDARHAVSPSQAQYEAWATWLRRRTPSADVPSYREFGCIAYRRTGPPA